MLNTANEKLASETGNRSHLTKTLNSLQDDET